MANNLESFSTHQVNNIGNRNSWLNSVTLVCCYTLLKVDFPSTVNSGFFLIKHKGKESRDSEVLKTYSVVFF